MRNHTSHGLSKTFRQDSGLKSHILESTSSTLYFCWLSEDSTFTVHTRLSSPAATVSLSHSQRAAWSLISAAKRVKIFPVKWDKIIMEIRFLLVSAIVNLIETYKGNDWCCKQLNASLISLDLSVWGWRTFSSWNIPLFFADKLRFRPSDDPCVT